jgi:hypothetical protein
MPMPDLLEKTGKIIFLRAHDLGTGYGPPNDFLDVEAVFILNSLGEGAYGFQLRNDDNLIEPGRINGTAIRVALIRDATSVAPVATGLKEFPLVPPRAVDDTSRKPASVARRRR